MYCFSFSWCLNCTIQNSYILQVSYYHIYLIRLVVLKRPGFQSQRYGMPTYDIWQMAATAALVGMFQFAAMYFNFLWLQLSSCYILLESVNAFCP